MEKDVPLEEMKKKISSPLFKSRKKGDRNLKNIVLYGFLVLMLFGLFFAFSSGGSPQEEKSLTEALDLIRQEKVEQVTVSGDTLELELKNGEVVVSRKEPERSFLEILETQEISPEKVSGEIVVEPPAEFSWLDFIINVLPVVLMLVSSFFFFEKLGKVDQEGYFQLARVKQLCLAKINPR